MSVADLEADLVGPLVVGPVAHGGHCVARHEGRVIFVRHALPGETVMVRVTDRAKRSFWRGDAVEVLQASVDRVQPPCPIAGECGGCDLQHVGSDAQLVWKTAVLREQLRRLAGIEFTGSVQAVPVTGEELPGTRWRTRMHFRNHDGRVGLLAARSHDVVRLPDQGCLIASRAQSRDELEELFFRARADSLDIIEGEEVTVLADGLIVAGPDLISHEVLGRRYHVRADGFWQVHPRAAEVLTRAVLERLEPREGETALDLYCGVGLFAGALVDRGVKVMGVESSREAVEQARHNVPEATFLSAPLERALRRLPNPVDLIVLDPPRAGAGKAVVSHVSGLGARAAVHVGCDPASFARDLGLYAAQGWRVERIEAFDLFPMTHHLEAVALLLR